jgi:predicted AlkP superfamily pyrophosphatase or phosphodiesterase
MDVAPTALEALGMGGNFDGRAIVHGNASRVIIVYVDALGWYRYHWAGDAAANISSISGPLMASSVYPSISNINAAAMATGVLPEKSGVDVWENRTILVPTSLEMARLNNMSAAWIDGPAPPISTAGVVSVQGTDDDVMDRAIVEYERGTRLLYVHLSGPDRALHASGPYSEASLEAIRHADALVGKMLPHVKPGTLVIVVADHGGHDIEGGRGDHGSLLPRDMLVPVFIRRVAI